MANTGECMEPGITDLNSLFERLNHGATLVSANLRLATTLRNAYEQDLMARGQGVWSTPDLLPWPAWLQRNWQMQWGTAAAGDATLLLSEQQELLLWEQTIAASGSGSALLQLPATARRAREAYGLMHAWRLPLVKDSRGQNEDCEAFRHWSLGFDTICRQRGCLPQARLPDALLAGLETGAWQAPATLLLLGFDELTPQQRQFCAALRAAGSDVQWLQIATLEGQHRRCELADARAEAVAAARWARARLEVDSEARIAIVVPDLNAMRAPIVQALDQVLLPETLQPQHWQTSRPYNLSLGLALSAYPLVRCALDVLELFLSELPLETASRLLRSPFIGGWETERHGRARLDAQLRANGELTLTFKTLRYWCGREDKPYYCPLLLAQLERVRALRLHAPLRQPAGAWVETLSLMLEAMDWSRGRALSSDEFQTLEAWRACLAGLAGLEPLTDEWATPQALSFVQRLAAARIFQPQRPALPIQVMGILETSGLHFDHVWVMGLHDGVWPAPPRSNPFLPLPVQRAMGLPRASAERELMVARRIHQRLLGMAKEVIFSTPLRDGERELRPSPLLTETSPVMLDELNSYSEPSWTGRIHAAGLSTAWETVVEDAAPPLSAAQARGGSRLFQLQAACPFRAFAELRLGAQALEEAEIGLDARARGSLMHQVLEQVWGELGSYDGLVARDAAALEALVWQAVTDAIGALELRHPQTLTQRFRSEEGARLHKLVLEWLALERRRAPFLSVMPEQSFSLCLGGVEVQVKIDRIDALPDGRKLLIDYKTGKVEPKQWFGARPDEPQLPLYSTVIDTPLAGVLFGQLQAGNVRFNGVAEEADLVPQVPAYARLKYTREAPSWSAVLADWRATLTTLAEGFHDGHAEVDPKDYPNTCRYCDLTPLCRINERTLLDANGDAADQEPD